MADQQFDTLQLVGVHVPDSSTEIDAGGNKYQQELPGTYEVGFVLGDTFLTLGVFKAGNYIDAIRQVGQGTADASAAQTASSETTQQPTADTPPAEQQPQG